MAELRSVGERWFAEETSFEEDLCRYWGDWGVDSEVGRLRAVLLRRPGREVEELRDPAVARWLELMDADLARSQHDDLAELYRSHGARVYYVQEMAADRPNALFVRDLVAMTPEGAILGRPAIAARRGEEKYVARTLAALDVPIIRTVSGGGTFEGADLMWVDRETVILGVGNRTNREGAGQVEEVLRGVGVENFLYYQIPYGHAHIDGLFNLADEDTCVFFPWQTPFEVADFFRRRGYRMIEIDSPEEAKLTMASNFVALEPGRVVMPAGSPRTQERMEEEGLEVITLDVTELQKGWGGIHCMTAFLKRDSL